MNATATLSDSAKALLLIKLVADCVKEAGKIPAGHLYAILMEKGCSLGSFDYIVGLLSSTANGVKPLVVRSNDLLIWNG